MRRYLGTLAFALLTLTNGYAFEAAFDGTDRQGAPTFRFVPVNYRTFALDFLGQRLTYLKWEIGSSTRLHSKNSRYVGTLTNGLAEIQASDKRGIVKKMTFKDGKVTRYFQETDDPEVQKADLKMLSAAMPRRRYLETLRTRVDLGGSSKAYWKSSNRLTLWYDNPNEAGAFLAMVAMFFFALALRFKKILRVISTVLAMAAVVGLWLTSSRGSLIGLVVGLAAVILVVCRKKLLASRKWFVVGFLCLLLPCAAVFCMRPREGMLNYSNQMRLNAWRAGPRLIAAAPCGWWRSSGHCYCDWIEDFDDDYSLRWLVNSHLSALAYVGWALGFCYLFVWTVLLGVMWKNAVEDKNCVALGVWSSLPVSMWFSTVGVSWSFWVLPALVALPELIKTVRAKRMSHKMLRNGLIVSAVLLGVAIGVGIIQELRSEAPFLVKKTTEGVQIGSGERKIYVVDDNHVLSGGIPGGLGKELRRHVLDQKNGVSIVLAESLADIPGEVGSLVVSGERCREYVDRFERDEDVPIAENLLFVSPTCPPADIPEELTETSRIRIVTGEFAAEVDKGYRAAVPQWVTKVPGCALYVPGWLNFAQTVSNPRD